MGTKIARIVLGLIFFVFGLNGFFQFMPVPPMPEGAMHLMGAFVESGYLLTLVKICEVVGGALLLSNLYVPLALTILAPIVVNIFFFHLFLAPSGLPVAILVVLLEAYLTRVNRESFKPLLKKR